MKINYRKEIWKSNRTKEREKRKIWYKIDKKRKIIIVDNKEYPYFAFTINPKEIKIYYTDLKIVKFAT